MQKNNYTVIIIIFIAVFFGLLSGMVGQIFARSYFSSLNLPFFGDINYSANGTQNLIIRGAKNVVIEQDKQSAETVKNASEVMVGIFLKKKLPPEPIKITVSEWQKYQDAAYEHKNALSAGLTVTSDGWIVSSFLPAEINAEKELSKAIKSAIISKYVIITKNKDIYEIDDLVFDKADKLTYWHVPAKDLTVRKFLESKEINAGEIVIAVNWQSQAFITHIMAKHDVGDLIKSSDLQIRYRLQDELSEEFQSAMVFNLTGDMVAIPNRDKKLVPVDNFNNKIAALLKYKNLTKAEFGVYYVNLADLLTSENAKSNKLQTAKGALVVDKEKIAVKVNGLAAKIGIEEGDIITSVNNLEINQDNDLADILAKYQKGQEIEVEYFRQGERKTAKINF